MRADLKSEESPVSVAKWEKINNSYVSGTIRKRDEKSLSVLS